MNCCFYSLPLFSQFAPVSSPQIQPIFWPVLLSTLEHCFLNSPPFFKNIFIAIPAKAIPISIADNNRIFKVMILFILCGCKDTLNCWIVSKLQIHSCGEKNINCHECTNWKRIILLVIASAMDIRAFVAYFFTQREYEGYVHNSELYSSL